MLTSRGNARKIAAALAIIAISASLGMIVDWRAPGISRYMHDWLMRARGPLPVPDDIAIVAIDEPSIARFGRFRGGKPASPLRGRTPGRGNDPGSLHSRLGNRERREG